MKLMRANLHLSSNLHGRTRERCPDVAFVVDDLTIATIRTDTEQPQIPLSDGEVSIIDLHDDALSRVIDEAAWLAELGRSIASGGELRLTLPASGPLAWLDSMNMYRYCVDIGKRGDAPDAALPTGWNRHYSREDATSLLRDAGFGEIEIRPTSYAAREIGMFANLFLKNWIGGQRDTEHLVYPRFGTRRAGDHPFPIGTTWSISARKTR